jgi:hypothetical protein
VRAVVTLRLAVGSRAELVERLDDLGELLAADAGEPEERAARGRRDRAHRGQAARRERRAHRLTERQFLHGLGRVAEVG